MSASIEKQFNDANENLNYIETRISEFSEQEQLELAAYLSGLQFNESGDIRLSHVGTNEQQAAILASESAEAGLLAIIKACRLRIQQLRAEKQFANLDAKASVIQ